MLSAWETVWVCVGLTLAVMVFDAGLAARSSRKSQDNVARRQARQQAMQFKNLEENGQ